VNESGVRQPHDEGSVFTRILASGLSDAEANIIHRGALVFAILNAFPYTSGHLMVLPYRELSSLEDLTPRSHRAVGDGHRRREGVRAQHARGVNGHQLGAPRGQTRALHVHVVSSWRRRQLHDCDVEARTCPNRCRSRPPLRGLADDRRLREVRLVGRVTIWHAGDIIRRHFAPPGYPRPGVMTWRSGQEI
jgi:diadenosine tetraphosphate (Ap4A) HIT family hydrolase